MSLALRSVVGIGVCLALLLFGSFDLGAYRTNMCALKLTSRIASDVQLPHAEINSVLKEEGCVAYLPRLFPNNDSEATDEIAVFHQGMTLWNDGLRAEAISVWRHVPTIAVYWYNRGLASDGIGKFDQAYDELQVAWALAPDGYRARIACALGNASSAQGYGEVALAHYEEASKIVSDNRAEQVAAGQAQWRVAMDQKDYQRALAIAEQLLEESKQSAPRWIMLGQTYSAMGEHRQAASAYSKASQLAPSNLQIRLLASRAHRLAGDWRAAFAHLTEVPPATDAWRYEYEKAMVLHAAGCERAAKDHWDRAASLEVSLGDFPYELTDSASCQLAGYR